jgi:hypothetical protein
MIKLQKKVFQFEYDGDVYKLKSPSVKDVTALQKRIEKDGESVDIAIDFLSNLGMKKEVCYEMEIDNLNTIIEAVVGAKKN